MGFTQILEIHTTYSFKEKSFLAFVFIELIPESERQQRYSQMFPKLSTTTRRTIRPTIIPQLTRGVMMGMSWERLLYKYLINPYKQTSPRIRLKNNVPASINDSTKIVQSRNSAPSRRPCSVIEFILVPIIFDLKVLNLCQGHSLRVQIFFLPFTNS